MATLYIASQHATAGNVRRELAQQRILALRDWLDGRWAVVFSDPDDFAPPPSTPQGFVYCLGDDFAAAGVKPIAFGRSVEHIEGNWFDHAVNDDAVVLIDECRADTPIDLNERALHTQLARLQRAFVVVLDEYGRSRCVITYDSRCAERPRSTGEILALIAAIRHGSSARRPHNQAQRRQRQRRLTPCVQWRKPADRESVTSLNRDRFSGSCAT